MELFIQFLEQFRDLIFSYILEMLKVGWWVFIPAIAIVYVPGRMLGFINSYRGRNIIGIVCLIGFSYLHVIMRVTYADNFEFVFMWIHRLSLGILWYVLVGFTLAERTDKFMDKKFAPDIAKNRK